MRSGISNIGVFKGSSSVEKPCYRNDLTTLHFSTLGGIFRLGDCSVIGRRAFDEMIAQLEPLNALVVRAEGKETSYRYHHLFAEFLQTELRRRHGEDAVVGVHRRASDWFEANGYMAEAVRHAREAADMDRCASLVEKAGGWELILFGGIGYLRGLLQQIPDDVAHAYPRILLAKAYLGVKDGLLAESRALVDAACNVKNAKTDSSLKRDILNVGTLIVVYEDAPVTLAELGQLEKLLSEVPSDELSAGIASALEKLEFCRLTRPPRINSRPSRSNSRLPRPL